MKTTIKAKELRPLADLINDCYDGNLAAASNDLSKAVYMLHYIDKGSVLELEFVNVCFALHKISQGLFDSHEKRIKQE